MYLKLQKKTCQLKSAFKTFFKGQLFENVCLN